MKPVRPERFVVEGSDLVLLIDGNVPSELGGTGSGFHGHAGIPGHQGGSAPGQTVQISEDEYRQSYYAFINSLTQDELQAVLHYTGFGYAINGVIKENRLSAADKIEMGHLDDAIAKYTLPNDMILYRGSYIAERFGSQANETLALLDKKEVNPSFDLEYQRPGYLSLTSDIHKSLVFQDTHSPQEHSVSWQIRVPKGTHAAPVGMEESEFLLPRNTNIKIDQVIDGSGRWTVWGHVEP